MNAPGRGAQRALTGSAVFLVVALASIVIGAPTAGAAPSGGISLARQTAEQARLFWTPERMRRARPMDIRMPARTILPAGTAASHGNGAPHRVAPRAARSGASTSSTFGEVTDPTSLGMRQNGVIFFSADGGLARCSGTSVTAPNFSVVLTAGHCVNDGWGSWYRGRWVFVPGYRYGQRPFGVFPAKWLDATRSWVSRDGENFDVGAAVVGRNEDGQRLGDAVGGAGIAWGLRADQVFDVHGYPVAPPFDGETQRLCAQTPFLGHDPESFLAGGPLNLAVDCDVTGGASGGGWTIDGDTLNGVTDYGYPDDPNTDFGAYFGKEVARLYHRAASVR